MNMIGGASRRLSVLAMIVAISFTSACSKVYEGAGSAFFRPPRRETSDRLDVLERRLGRLQSEMGITAYDFEFNIPRGNKLLATLRADLNGQVVPELSGVFHVPASNNPRLRYGHVTIYYTDPPLSSEPTVPGAWHLDISGPDGNGFSWAGNSPFLGSVAGSPGVTVGYNESKALGFGRDQKVWEYRAVYQNPARPDSGSFIFDYTLSVKFEPLAADEKLEKIQRVDLPPPSPPSGAPPAPPAN
jgi:hypothetical protein